LVVDDNKEFVDSIKIALNRFNVISAYSIIEAKEKLNQDLDLILLDIVLDEKHPDDLQGLNFIPQIRQNYTDMQIVVMTNYSSTKITVDAIKAGAVDFFNKKDLHWSEWKNRLEHYCKNATRIRELKTKTEELEQKTEDSDIIGSSAEIDFLRKRIRDLAEHSDDISILLVGETGTGKNLAVKYFKKHSSRKDQSYKEFSISELSETLIESELFGHVKGAFTGATSDKKGLFEEANGGILFLDEIGDYDLKIQKKIMRFIEDKTITPVGGTTAKKLNVQLILATNQDIPQLIAQGKFREDLYQRINRIKIELPPLRKRKGDIPELTNYFFNNFRIKEKTNLQSISNDVYDILNEYPWPGNIRELQSVIWDACTHARMYKDKTLLPKHLRKELTDNKINNYIIAESTDLEKRKALLELEEIEKALERKNGKKSEAAKMLGMSLDQMRYRIEILINKHPKLVSNYPYIKEKYGY
jgi:DNA-binding NtrC family response regulator